jgi:hypothetical protein
VNGWSAFWLSWAAAGVVVESLAIHGKRHPKDTLSRNLQYVLQVHRPVVRWFTLAGWIGFSAWFADHIWG